MGVQHAFCGQCGQPLSPGDRFCGGCGQPVQEPERPKGSRADTAAKPQPAAKPPPTPRPSPSAKAPPGAAAAVAFPAAAWGLGWALGAVVAILLDQFLALYGIHHPVSAAVLLVCGAAGGAVAGLAARLAGAGSTVLDLRTGGLTVAGWTGVMAVILLALPFNALIVAVVLALAAAGLAQVAARLGGGAGGMTLSLAWAGGAVVGALLHWAWFMWAYF